MDSMIFRAILGVIFGLHAANLFAKTETTVLAPDFDRSFFHYLSVKHWIEKAQAKHPTLSFHIGGFWATQGQDQDVDITGLIGDSFSVTHHSASNGLLGLAAYFDGWANKNYTLQYGVDAFYLGKTAVQGFVTQEQFATNLAYGYNLTNAPIFFGIKARPHYLEHDHYAVTLNLGIGPNIINTSNFKETALASYVLPDEIYTGHTTVAFAAMAGLGLRVNNAFGKTPLECGYRFFYLGEGSLKTINSQVLTSLKTGHNYANTLMCSLEIG